MSEGSSQSEPRLEPTGERYLPEMGGDIESEHRHRYEVAFQYAAGLDVLDIACGEGYGSARLSEVARRVVGIDIDPATVAHATGAYSSDNLQFFEGDCTDIEWPDDSFDLIVSFETIEHHDAHEAMVREFRRVLRDDGLLILSSPDRVEYSEKPGHENPFHVKELSRHELACLLEPFFSSFEFVGQRLAYGSLIFHGDDSPLILRGEWRPMYWLVFATNAVDRPALPPSSLSLTSQEESELVKSYKREIAGQAESLATVQGVAQSRMERIDSLEEALRVETAAREEAEERSRENFFHLAVLSHRVRRPQWLMKRMGRAIWRAVYRPARRAYERQRILESGVFDADWYIEHNDDVRKAGIDPLIHFHKAGAYEGRRPAANVDLLAHLEQYPGLLESTHHPFVHYLDTQRHSADSESGSYSHLEALLFDQLFTETKGESPDYVSLAEARKDVERSVRAIAFYLPQFHPIPENDRWWGAGFTEWTNVGKSIPQFVGHYQPRHPGELGYYDLRVPEVQERQAELASQHGVSAFCFHYYWFSGKRLLDQPILQFANNPNINFPFCLCWANENWTRRWDGKENDVLIAQEHNEDDDHRFIEDIAPLLRHPDYLRVNGKLVLLVYRIDQLPEPQKTADTWRQYARAHDLGELHLIAVSSFANADPRPYGFDAAVEFPPHQTYARRIEEELTFFNPDFAGHVYDYADLVWKQLAVDPVDYRRYRTVVPGWDNSARKPGAGHAFDGATPGRYQQWLAGVVREAEHLPEDERLVFVNAWNEWAEGAYLEPDRHYGYAYLEATRQAVSKSLRFPPNSAVRDSSKVSAESVVTRIAVLLHLHHHDLWEEMADQLAVLESDFDLYISLSDESDNAQIKAEIWRRYPGAMIHELPNRGRDILPTLLMLREVNGAGYDAVCKLHSKRSLHRGDGDRWRRALIDNLLGSPGHVAAICRAFSQNPDLGMVGPAGHWLPYSRYWGSAESPEQTRALMDQLGVRLSLSEVNFFAGSMFWFRPETLSPLLDLQPNDFEPECGQTDGTLAHALERIFAALVICGGWRVTDSDNPAAIAEPRPVFPYAYAQESQRLPGASTFQSHRSDHRTGRFHGLRDSIRSRIAAHPRLHATLRPFYLMVLKIGVLGENRR